MASAVKQKATAVLIQGDAPLPSSKLPAFLRFPLVASISVFLSAFLNSALAGATEGELAGVSNELQNWEVVALLGWKIAELAVGWYGDYDGYDIACLSLLGHGPALYLLGAFYNIRTTTVLASLVFEGLSIYIPFRLLRPLSLAHSASKSDKSLPVPNSEILNDYSVNLLAIIYAASIYSVTLFTSYRTFLPSTLVVYFDGIPSVEAAHNSSYLGLIPLTWFLGVAAKTFVFTPAIVAVPNLSDAKNAAFNPSRATLSETFWRNIWGYSTRTKVVLKRTATLMLVSGGHTFTQTFITVQGVEAWGAFVYSAIWVVAAGIAGLALGAASAAA